MNSPHYDRPNEPLSPAEQTLRMLAQLPTPDGLLARLQASLRTGPQRRRLFSFNSVFGPSGWMHNAAARTAAAFGIVCVVAGGGWRIYSHVQTSPGMQGIAVPVRVNTGTAGEGGFSTSGAIAKPDPLKAPVITHHLPNATPANQQPPIQSEKKAAKKKPSAKIAPSSAEHR